MAEFHEFYVDTQSGQSDIPLYDKWFKWAKFATNWVTIIFAYATLIFFGTHLDSTPGLLAVFVILILLRTAEVAKETIPLFLCGQSFAWVQACCKRKDAAREVDKAEKYLSSLIFGPLTAGLAIALFVKHTAVHGCLVVGIVALIDFCMGAWVVYTDEWRKDFHKVRSRPDEFDLDDNMDPFEAEEDQIGMLSSRQPISRQPSAYQAQSLSRQISSFDHHPKVVSLSGIPSSSSVQKGAQIKSQPSEVAVLYAPDDDPADARSKGKGGFS